MKDIDFRRDLLPHKNRLYRLAMGILLDSAEAEDTVEDTLIRVWEETRVPAGKSIDNLPAYLTTICRNLALDRAQRCAAQNIELTADHDRPATNADDEALHERYERTVALIQQLSEPQRSCLILRDIEGYSYQEIAAILKLTEAQVKINIHRGRQTVRDHFSL